MNKIIFENHHNVRVMELLFPEGFEISSEDDLQTLKNAWKQNLKSWHTPYTCLLDLRKFQVSQKWFPDFLKLISFFQKFHMKKIIGFKEHGSILSHDFNFEIFDSYEKARQHTGLSRAAGLTRDIMDLRQRITIENDFHAHVMEISFLSETTFNTKDDVLVLKSKIKNILRQWHTPYSILMNCFNVHFTEEAKEEFYRVEKFLKSFFCKEIIGYSPVDDKLSYPFKTFRSRHVAAGGLESVGAFSGDVANCAPKIKK